MCMHKQSGLFGKRETQNDIFEQHKSNMKIHTDWSGKLKSQQQQDLQRGNTDRGGIFASNS